MRWDELFGDLDAQFYEAQQQDLEHEVSELARVEASQFVLADALRGSILASITVVLNNDDVIRGVLERVGTGWLMLSENGQSVVVPTAQISRVTGLSGRRIQSSSRIDYPLPAVLRLLSRNRAVVLLTLDSSNQTNLRGVIDQAGADFIVLAQLADGNVRRGDNWQGLTVVPLASLRAIRSSRDNDI